MDFFLSDSTPLPRAHHEHLLSGCGIYLMEGIIVAEARAHNVEPMPANKSAAVKLVQAWMNMAIVDLEIEAGLRVKEEEMMDYADREGLTQ
jgi:hypothetical protein